MTITSEQRPEVTVIIPTYNSGGTLRLSLASVLMQDHTSYEVWVIGDGCDDDSGEVVESFNDPRLHWLNLSRNSGGPAQPRNAGLHRARGNYIAYLGHDDVWFPWHLSGLVEYLRNNDYDFTYSLGANIGPEGVISFFSLPENRGNLGGGVSPSNWMHLKSVTEAMGCWSVGKGVGDDLEFLTRLQAGKFRTGFYRRLSVIKFPAILWNMYSLSSDFPQQKYVDDICRNPAALCEELLLDYAVTVSRQKGWLRKNENTTMRILRELTLAGLNLYGHHRWPVNKLLYRRWRKKSGLNRLKNVRE